MQKKEHLQAAPDTQTNKRQIEKKERKTDIGVHFSRRQKGRKKEKDEDRDDKERKKERKNGETDDDENKDGKKKVTQLPMYVNMSISMYGRIYKYAWMLLVPVFMYI